MAGGIDHVRGVKRRTLTAGAPWGPHPAMLHLDIDAFFASVEQLRAPALRGRPVIVGTGVVASASYEARAHGIRAGTTLRDARRRCPEAVLLPGHAPTYRAFSERVFELAGRLGPDLETYLDDAVVELTGTEGVHGHLIRAAARLQRDVRRETGLGISMGLATNRTVARMLTRLSKPGGFAWLRPGGEADFVAGRPIEELPGIGRARAALLREMGIASVGQLRRLAPDRLRTLFGEVGAVIAERARGRETRVVSRRELPRSIRRETSFGEPATEGDVLEAMLHYLTERATGRLRSLGARARALRVHLYWADGGRAARSTRLPGAGEASTEAIFAHARALLGGLCGRRLGVRNLGVEVSRLHIEPAAQLGLFARREREARLESAVDSVRQRFGFQSMVRGRSLDLLDRLPSDRYGFVLRTPCLTR